MRCVWCDSEYTFTGGEKKTFDSIFEQLEEFGCQLVEVTGGEPLAQKAVFPFITELCDRGYEVLIETGNFVSTKKVDERAKLIIDIKCPASGEAERNHWDNMKSLDPNKDEVKFVVADPEDWDFAKEKIREFDLERRAYAVLVSPVFETPHLKEIAEAVATSGLRIRMNMQLHKFIWGKDVHGV